MLQLVNFVNTVDVAINRSPTHTGTYRMAAKPDLDDGWLPYAHELDAALAVADFTKGARIVLREVFAQIFGMAKLKSAAISPSAIANRAGMMREHISRAVKELVDAGALIRLSDGTFRFVKDYESWTRKGEPRLSHAELTYCQTARDSAISYAVLGRPKPMENGRNNPGNTSTEDRNTSVTGGVPESLRNRNSLGTESVPESLRSGVLPYRNAGAEFEKEREEENTPLTPQGGNEVVKLSIPQEDTNTPRSQRQSKATPEEVNALIAWAKKVIGDRGELEFYFQKLAGWACSYPIDWIEAAVLCTAAGADSIKPGKLAPHTNKCLINWHPNGPPRDERATADRQRGRDQPTAPLVYEQDDPSKAAEYARIERSYELSRKRNEEKRKCG